MTLVTSILQGGVNSHSTTSEEVNALSTDFVSEGVVGTIGNTSGVAPSTGAFAVNAQGTPNMTVAVSAGVGYVTATPTSGTSQNLRVKNSASANVTIASNATGGTRYDWVYIKIDPDKAQNPAVDASDVATLVTSRSTSASVDNGTPPTYGTELAVITVANGASSITNANIRDIRVSSGITIASQAASADWSLISGSVTSVVNNGNRSYSLTTSADNTALVSPGMRLRTIRTVAAPTQCTSLNGTTQYYSKTSPAGMTFTDDFVVSAWVKMTSYASNATIISRYNGTSGWTLQISAAGQPYVYAFNAGAGNYSQVNSYQSIPLNKWVHIAVQLDMSTFTATSTTSYVMIDGVDVPSVVTRAGTNPTALVQAGNLEIGSSNGGTNPFPGKIAQAAVFSAKVTQATMRGYMSQGFTGTETSLISAYSFNNSITDLNTTSANNLTANGSAVATNADSPFGNSGISSTLDYGIVQTINSTTVVVQVAEGCTIPTSGGVSAVSYSSVAVPYGFPSQKGKWTISEFLQVSSAVSISGYSTNLDLPSIRLGMPVGAWKLAIKGAMSQDNSSGGSIFTQVWLSLSQAGSQIYQTKVQVDYQAATLHQFTSVYSQTDIETSAAATIYGVVYTTTGGGTVTGGLRGDQCPVTIELENSYL